MIEVSSSPSAKVAANAEAAIARITEELAALQASSEEMRGEMRELLSERAASQQRRDDLAVTVAQARATLQTYQTAEEVTQGVAELEGAAREATQAASAAWDDAHQALGAHEAAWRERGQFLDQRLDFLQKSLDEAASMSASLQARMEQLRAVYDASHSQHGRDEQARLEQEFTAIAERRATAQQLLAEIEQQETALRNTIAGRLKDWPALARESLAAHLEYQPGAWVRILRAWETLAQLAGDDGRVIDQQTWQAYLGETSLPLYHLTTFAPRERFEAIPEPKRDVPLRQYARLLTNLAETLARLEASEREKQVNEQMHGI